MSASRDESSPVTASGTVPDASTTQVRQDSDVREDMLRVRQLRIELNTSLHQDRLRGFGNADWTTRQAWMVAALKDLERFLRHIVSAFDKGATLGSVYPGPTGETSSISGLEKLPQRYGELYELLKQGIRYLGYVVEEFTIMVKCAAEAKEKTEGTTTKPLTAELLREQLANVRNQGKSRSPAGTPTKQMASVPSAATTEQATRPTVEASKAAESDRSHAAAVEDEFEAPTKAPPGEAPVVRETGFVLKSVPEAAKPSHSTSKTRPKSREALYAVPKSVSEDPVPHVGTLPAQRKARQAPSYENLTADRQRQPYAMSPTHENATEEAGPSSPLPGFTPTSSPSKSRFADRYTPKTSPSASQPASPSSSPRSATGIVPGSSSRRPQMPSHAHTSRGVRSEYEPRTPEQSPRRGSYHGYSSPRHHQHQLSDERRQQSSPDDRPSMSRHESRRSERSSTTFGEDMIPTTGRIAAREARRGSGHGSRHEDVREEPEEEETSEDDEDQEEEEEDDTRRFRIRDRVKRFFS